MTLSSRPSNTVQEPSGFLHMHAVQFSEDEASLLDAVSRFLGSGLRAREGCLLVATATHRQQIEQRLLADGVNITEAMAQGSYVALDAAATLARFFLDGKVHPLLFAQVLEPLIVQVAQSGRKVRIFGEMVALLWAQSNQAAAIRLEDLWNELGNRRDFSLLCAYPLRDFGGQGYEAPFRHICQQHSQVFLTERYTRLSEQEQGRAFALLQQKALSLEIEVAERNAAQARLQMLAAIVSSSEDAILSKDLSGVILSWNSAAERVYGYSEEEMIGQSVTLLFPPDHHEEFEQIMACIRQGKQVEHHETERVCKDGTILPVSVTISPIKDETGVIIGASSIARDITKQRLLADKSQRLFDSNLVGIFVANHDGVLQEANQAFLDLLGYTREAWQPEAIGDKIGAAFAASGLRPLVKLASQGSYPGEPQEMVLYHKNGRAIPGLVAVTCIEPTSTCIGFVLDISERKVLEQRKDTFIGMASHELKTPVTSLKGFLTLLQRQLAYSENKKVLHYLMRMEAQIEKLVKLINDLLDISRIEAGLLVYREESIDVDALVQDIVESVGETTQTHRFCLQGVAAAQVFGDRDRLGQILINLLNNAIKYSPNANTVVVHLAADHKQVLISVQDFGLGIAADHHHKIFERFYQVTDHQEKTYPGLGIGLAIAQEIVKRHRGRLWVESEHGKGATFHLSLPLLQQRDRPVEMTRERG